ARRSSDLAPPLAAAGARLRRCDVERRQAYGTPDRGLVAAVMPVPAGHTAPLADGTAPPSFEVELPHFAGPLDLLLALIREEQVDIYDIPIARIAEQFVQRIRTFELNEAAEYLEMAARLLRIKAQLLLPSGEQE